ncbi:peroxidase family protein [Agromyces sp. SYSU T00194]|uniref:peroxidase family protein n=1 Tax=Agromyces chitinivorans TaxID=3158560 RepID=UPI0033972360
MLQNLSHAGASTAVEEILFSTPFGYMFPELASNPDHCLPTGQDTTRALLALGTAMATDELTTGSPSDTDTSSFFTYFGQFIDHDLTARTDRETETSEIFAPDGGALPIVPRAAAEVAATLRNGRRPQFDLDSVYGDGPAMLVDGSGAAGPGADTNAHALYDSTFRFRLQDVGPTVDLPRPDGRTALVADARNDENVNVSQLHAAFLSLHNAVMDGLAAEGVTGPTAYARARQYVRWVYQYLVIEEYLKAVCLEQVVEDCLRNGPVFYGPVAGGEPLFMPLEFSVAAFRFGHSMIRPSYRMRGGTLTIMEILGVSAADRHGGPDLLQPVPGANPAHAFRLAVPNTVDWGQFFGTNAPNKARRIDTSIAGGLGQLTFVAGGPSVMAHLAQRNLLRGFSLSMPTGQAVARACGVQPLTPVELTSGETPAIVDALAAGLTGRTPLWYYVLREAAVQASGVTLGVVGSRIVAECLIGLLRKDPNSVLNQYGIARNVTKEGIVVPTAGGRRAIGGVEDFLRVAGVHVGKLPDVVGPMDRLTGGGADGNGGNGNGRAAAGGKRSRGRRND